MKSRTLIAAGLIVAAGSAMAGELMTAPYGAASDGLGEHNCSCINRGSRTQLGDLACLRVGKRQYTAQCVMTLNNPSWHFVRDGCEPQRISWLAVTGLPTL
jgi:hypothetical protein